MIGRAHHLHDDRLFDWYLAGHSGAAREPATADHLAGCHACRDRLVELSEFFDSMRRDADAESDDVFSADLLRHQHDQILRRLLAVNRAARVISFPTRAATPAARAGGRLASRWLVAAAVAGIVVGAAASGAMLQSGIRRAASGLRPGAASARISAPAMASAPAPLISDTVDDELFLKELELALERPRTRELLPFDALTPHVRDVGSWVP